MNQEQVELFYEIFYPGLPRLGPGDSDSTQRALRTVLGVVKVTGEAAGRSFPETVLDIGCGNGPQTIRLALDLDCTIVALDNHRPYLDELERKAEEMGVAEKIQTRLGDMNELRPDREHYDLIWSEGALFVMGFRAGVERCFGMLTPGGCLAASELCWLRKDAPRECREFFDSEYPAMSDVSENLSFIEDCGFEILDHFTLPESAWRDNYYLPLAERLDELEAGYPEDPARIEIIDRIRLEIETYGRYSTYYGYEFFVARR